MKREIKFNPVQITTLGVNLYCANNEIADEFLKLLAETGLPTAEVVRRRQDYAYNAQYALNVFLEVYNEINTRN